MLMVNTAAQKNQNEDDESESKYRWVQCPDMPDELLVCDGDENNEPLHKRPNEIFKNYIRDKGGD